MSKDSNKSDAVVVKALIILKLVNFEALIQREANSGNFEKLFLSIGVTATMEMGTFHL